MVRSVSIQTESACTESEKYFIVIIPDSPENLFVVLADAGVLPYCKGKATVKSTNKPVAPDKDLVARLSNEQGLRDCKPRPFII